MVAENRSWLPVWAANADSSFSRHEDLEAPNAALSSTSAVSSSSTDDSVFKRSSTYCCTRAVASGLKPFSKTWRLMSAPICPSSLRTSISRIVL